MGETKYKIHQSFYLKPQTKFFEFGTGKEIEKQESAAKRRRFVNYVRKENQKKLENNHSVYGELYQVKVPYKRPLYLEIGSVLPARPIKKPKTPKFVNPFTLPKMNETPFPLSSPKPPLKIRRFLILLFVALIAIPSICYLEHSKYLEPSILPLITPLAANALSFSGLLSIMSILAWLYSLDKFFLDPRYATVSPPLKTFRISTMVLLTILCLHAIVI